ncbi:RICIN domain-containing protein [Streptomyces griseus]|uniref:RICIN domain-containing protein n=1 Tax=Streptomyces griseus TaxID=1911 RepID=UPI00099B85A7|nr:RICIN domain-containing protein [Streptomyces griseus]
MQSPNPPRPPYPPRPGWSPGDSDRNLLAQLGASGADSGPGACAVALLLARHWRATFDYAVVCLASAEDSARMVATTAFNRVLGRAAGGAVSGALRPQLLVAVRETVREWAGDEAISTILPELRKTVGGRGLRASGRATPEKRQIAERAFRTLPGASQCLLWHTEVEAEPISVPAGLLGVDSGTATAAREQAREQFRAGCVRAHRELAPTAECRYYNRLLDVAMRRGGELLPDVRKHLTECQYCRRAAEQLGHFDGGLEVLLAETVLGWGARRYLDSRPGRATGPAGPVPAGAASPGGGRHRSAHARVIDTPRRHPKAVLVGVALSTLALLASVLVAKGWSEDTGAPPGPGMTWGAPVGNSGRASTSDEPSPAGSSAASVAGQSEEVARGRLRSLTEGLCLDARGGRAEAGVTAVLVACSSAGSQQWSYQEDGLLRSAADPTLCLDSDAVRKTVTLAGCLVHSGAVSYDLTVRGELLLRHTKGLIVAPARAGSPPSIVVTARDGSRQQRWRLEPGTGRGADGERDANPGSRQRDEPRDRPQVTPSAEPPADLPVPPGAAPAPVRPAPPQPGYEPRIAQVACCETPDHHIPAAAPPALPPIALPAPVDTVRQLPATLDVPHHVSTLLGPVPGRSHER